MQKAALLLARNIHADFTIANASAWQWWSSTEPKMGRVPRYCLVEADPKGAESYRATKLLWALGHFSRFIRPGMVRVGVDDGRPVAQSLSTTMASAYLDPDTGHWTAVLVNFSDRAQPVEILPQNLPASRGGRKVAGWLTDRERNMERFDATGGGFVLPPRSLATLATGAAD